MTKLSKLDIRLKAEGNGYVTLRNVGGNKAFYFLEALRKENVGVRLSTGEGPFGVFRAVKFDMLPSIRQRAEAAGLAIGFATTS